MGSSRKKKLKKATFQKVKLKVGKKLPKANSTDTRFKTKKIRIVGQLQNTDITDGNEVAKDISSILPKLQHYNANMRIATSTSLKDVLRANPELVEQHLSLLLERVVELIMDADPQVRDLANELLVTIFTSVTIAQITPFFGIVLSYLSCGMNHISKSIQMSSLRTFDLLMAHCPNLLKNSSDSLLDNFLNLMSKQKNENFWKGAPASGASGKDRVLSADPSANVSGDAWYHAVFLRLEQFFRVIIPGNDTHLSANDGLSNDIAEYSVVKMVFVNCEKRANFELYSASANGFQSETYSERKSGVSHDRCSLFIDDIKTKELLSSLVPLLIQGWMSSSTQRESSGHDLLPSVVIFRHCIASIVHMFIMHFESIDAEKEFVKWFCKQHSKRLLEVFMAHFPYSVVSPRRKKKMPRLESDDAKSAVELNILLCDIVTSYNMHVTNLTMKYHEVVASYFKSIFGQEIDVTTKQLHIVCKALKVILMRSKRKQFANEILKDALKMYRQLPRENEKRVMLKSLFKAFAFDDCYLHLRSFQAISDWMHIESQELLNLKTASWESLTIVRTMVMRGCREFAVDIFDNLPKILEQIGNISVKCEKMEESQKIVIELLYWCPEIHTDCFTSLLSVYNSRCLPLSTIRYSFQMLNTRFLGDLRGHWCGDIAKYVSFLLGCAAGVFKQELMKLANKRGEFDNGIQIVMDSDVCVEYHQSLADIAVRYLMNVTSVGQLRLLSQTYILQLLGECRILPLRTVICLCRLISALWEMLPGCISDGTTDLCLALLKTSITSETNLKSDVFNLLKKMVQFSGLQLKILNRLHNDVTGSVIKENCHSFGEMLHTIVEMVPLEKLQFSAVRDIINSLEVLSEACRQSKWWASVTYHLDTKLRVERM